MTVSRARPTGQPAPPQKTRPTALGNPHTLARKIAEVAAEQWHRAAGCGHLEAPLSVVAALSLLRTSPAAPSDIAAVVDRLDDSEFTAFIRTIWAMFLNARPDLANRAWPLVRPWFDPDPRFEDFLYGVRRVATAVLKAGLLDLTGTDRRYETDVLGPVLTLLRSDQARQAASQFYTPPEVALAMVELTGVGDAKPGESVLEPAAGTGGLLRAAAQAVRAKGGDPSRLRWVAVDPDQLAIACASYALPDSVRRSRRIEASE